MQADLFAPTDTSPQLQRIDIAAGVVLLRHAAICVIPVVDWDALIEQVAQQAPFRHMQIAPGKTMSAAMTNCGSYGWTASHAGYAYTTHDPLSGEPWPAMPAAIAQNAPEWAAQAGFDGFVPDACLINRYGPQAQMGMHQDKDEYDRSQPIVSISLGSSVCFTVGGLKRSDSTHSTLKIDLHHGDVLVFGGPARLRYHGVGRPVQTAQQRKTGQPALRYNLTIRRAQ